MRLAFKGASSWFERGVHIVLPSYLLASATAHEFAAYQLRSGLSSWSGPNIYSIEAWLASLWQDARFVEGDVPTLLSPLQERFLWQRLIERDFPHLFDIAATARLAQRAAKISCEWHIPVDEDLWHDNTDGQQFQYWYKQFRQLCREAGWISRSDLWDLVPKWFASGVCGTRPTVFAGFEAFSPGLEKIRRTLADLAGAESATPLARKETASAKEFGNFEQEIESAARWARARFEQRPDSAIGVFVADLPGRHLLVERTFRRVFYPSQSGSILPGSLRDEFGPDNDSVFHISGRPLREHPLIASALLLQELARPRIQVADAGAILRCPFIAGAGTERSIRALAELDLRRKRELDVTLTDLEQSSRPSVVLQKVWFHVRQVLRKIKPEQDFPAWSKFIGDLLEAVGWPGDLPLTLSEQQAVDMWNDALSNLGTLGLVSGPISFDIALSHLQHMLASSGPESGDWSSPVQILDATDSPGLRFDYAFLAGLSEENWPPVDNPSPLIPPKLQRLHKVPGSSQTSRQSRHQTITIQLLGIAPEVLVTYSGRLSPLVEGYTARKKLHWPQWDGKLPRQSYDRVSLDCLEDTNAPPYLQARPRGGTSLIRLQSLCPFRAFGERRLNAVAPDEGCFGLDSLERGTLLHDALRSFWDRVKTQDRLKQIDAGELQLLITEIVDEVVKSNSNGPLHEQVSQVERTRLRELLLDWMRVERERKHAFAVETTEQERLYEVAGLQLKLRIDRVDRLANGKLLLIDYKSGEPSASHLDRERPKEPQLLVYAAALGAEVDGVFFAQLKPRDPRLVGYSRQAHTQDRKSRVLPNWDRFLADRRSKVEELAREFAAGEAAVDPLNGACEYCQIKPFCRLNERLQEEEDSE